MAKYYFRSYYLTPGEDGIYFFSSPEEREYFIHQRYDDYTPIKYSPSIADWDADDIVELSGMVVGFSGEIEC